ncbi:uncharacterized protein RJT20DRAFT_128521 [Scheffersomyces xylosifermentans]|uniref:uncharacterized protein n=1 Tax=Scheffersomyces xylosifermentans TaxID=1304137 RepID=UPI00315CAD36
MSLESYPKQPLTSVYRKEAITKKENGISSVLVMIPGNPGLVEFYVTYLELIQEEFPQLELFCISHAGFQTTEPITTKEFKFYDLEFQVKHKVEVLADLIHQKLEDGNKIVELYFLSHSVGSFIHQKVIRQLLEDDSLQGKFVVKFTGLICPTIIDIAQSQNGTLFTKLFAYLPVVWLLVFFSRFINFIWSEAKIRRILGNHFVEKPKKADAPSLESWQNSVTGAYKLVSSERLIQQAVTMAKQEMKVILTDEAINDWFFSKLPDTKIWVFFATKDYWVHDAARDYLLARYHDSDNKNLLFEVGDVEDPITHSFCVHQSVEFSLLTIQALRSIAT